jgi:hypothetical protein
MKTLLYTIALLSMLLCSGCSKESKAKSAIKNYLFKVMYDYNSYQPVEYGKLDSTFSNYNSTTEFKNYDSLREQMEDTIISMSKTDSMMAVDPSSLSSVEIDNAVKKIRADTVIIARLIDSVKKTNTIIDKKRKEYKPSFSGYSIFHSYRGKNANGAYVLAREVFFLNKSLDTVFESIDADSLKR